MAPVPEGPEQDIAPWQAALEPLLTDRELYTRLSQASRAAALNYARNLTVRPFEELLENVVRAPKRPTHTVATPNLSPEKRKLLALRLRQKLLLPYLDRHPGKPLLLCFPYAVAR